MATPWRADCPAAQERHLVRGEIPAL